ncbi:nucleolar protein of 40 kDa-like [Chelonus insularis]|uniref:nucleolar protein of 40 kDa-like n=1 Tax=Chelonus insularis TaxID=460826 RepID=UPI0015882C86|nr:nucleolar protein of 40 kDa-like [Chelonus insularis]
MTSCEINKIFKGKIAAVQNYGAFVEIPGFKQQGLIHKSQVSSSWVDDVAQVLQRGEHVWCKIISIGDDGKIGLSMKLVNQGDGTDLDPTGIERMKDEQKRKTVGPPQKKVIQLQAVLNRTCRKCGLQGHFEHDCFGSIDGKKYELLPEIQDDLPPSSTSDQQPQLENDDVKVKKNKEKLKKKKSKKSKQKSVDSSDDDSSDDEKKRKKKKKKHLKSKKRKRKHSKSSSDDSEDNVREKHSKKCKHSRSKYSD